MKTASPLAALSLALSIAGFSTARATPVRYGDYTVDVSLTDGMNVTIPWYNTFDFWHAPVSGDTSTPYATVTASGSITATFQADPGRIFDKLYFGGLQGGWFSNNQGGASASLDWAISTGTYTGPSANYGNSDFRGFDALWEITGPQTGHSYVYDGYWFQNPFIPPVSGLGGYYSIEASSFTIDITALVRLYNQGGWGDLGIAPAYLEFAVGERIDAPPPSSVPDGAQTAGLMLLGLIGAIGVRRCASITGNSG